MQRLREGTTRKHVFPTTSSEHVNRKIGFNVGGSDWAAISNSSTFSPIHRFPSFHFPLPTPAHPHSPHPPTQPTRPDSTRPDPTDPTRTTPPTRPDPMQTVDRHRRQSPLFPPEFFLLLHLHHPFPDLHHSFLRFLPLHLYLQLLLSNFCSPFILPFFYAVYVVVVIYAVYAAVNANLRLLTIACRPMVR